MEGCQWGGRGEEWGEKVQGLRSIIGRNKVYGEIKNSIGNLESKELTCMTHGHELRVGHCWREGGCRAERDKGEKKWDNYNSIINKIYLKIK